MKQTVANSEPETLTHPELDEPLANEQLEKVTRERTIVRLRLLWNQRRFLSRCAGCGLLIATLIAFLIPKRYESTEIGRAHV